MAGKYMSMESGANACSAPNRVSSSRWRKRETGLDSCAITVNRRVYHSTRERPARSHCEFAPGALIALLIASNERVRFRGAFAARCVIWKRGSGQLRPGFFDGRDDSPLRFHFVAAGEQRGVSARGIGAE